MSLEAEVGLQLGSLDLDVDITVDSGEVVAHPRAERRGKTTLLQALAGLLSLDPGGSCSTVSSSRTPHDGVRPAPSAGRWASCSRTTCCFRT